MDLKNRLDKLESTIGKMPALPEPQPVMTDQELTAWLAGIYHQAKEYIAKDWLFMSPVCRGCETPGGGIEVYDHVVFPPSRSEPPEDAYGLAQDLDRLICQAWQDWEIPKPQSLDELTGWIEQYLKPYADAGGLLWAT